MNARRLLVVALLGCLALVASGCSVTHTVTPTNRVLVPDLTSPDATLGTIKTAVEAKGLQGGDAAYRACFADSTTPTTPAFHAYFAPENASAWVGNGHLLPSDWTLQNEAAFYDVGPLSLINLHRGKYQMSWAPDPSSPGDAISSVVAMLHRHYSIVAGGVVITRGYADLTLARSSAGAWEIVLWNDRVDVDPTLTWGQRRLESQSQ